MNERKGVCGLRTHHAVVAFDPAKTSPEVLTEATTDAGFPSAVKQQ